MEPIREALAPLTDWIPSEARDLIPVEAWWLILLVLALACLLVLGHLVRGAWRGLFRRKRKPVDWDKGLRRDLQNVPPPATPPGSLGLAVYHVPGRLRLVVVAPAGIGGSVNLNHVDSLLDRIVPGLAEVVTHDQPEIKVWPPQLSYQGFINSFHRCTPTHEPEGQPSHWILVAGKVQPGGPAFLVGLAVWTETPSTIGRLNLQPYQWLDVIRLRRPGG